MCPIKSHAVYIVYSARSRAGNEHWRNQDFVLRGPENRGAVGAEFETTKASSGEGNGEGIQPTRGSGERRKLPQILVHFELEKTNLVMTNLIFFCHFYSSYLESNLQGEL